MHEDIAQGIVWLPRDGRPARCIVKITNPRSGKSIFVERLEFDENFRKRYNQRGLPRSIEHVDSAAIVINQWYRSTLCIETNHKYPLGIHTPNRWWEVCALSYSIPRSLFALVAGSAFWASSWDSLASRSASRRPSGKSRSHAEVRRLYSFPLKMCLTGERRTRSSSGKPARNWCRSWARPKRKLKVHPTGTPLRKLRDAALGSESRCLPIPTRAARSPSLRLDGDFQEGANVHVSDREIREFSK